jgi:enoyl-CoA hydratase/carnithine racemase
LAKRRELSVEARRERLEGLHDLIRAVRDCPKPVIAAVEGAAAGAGLSLAMACDLLVAAKDAKFSVAYVKVGLTPDGGATAFLAEFVSRQVLTELCLTGAPLSGERMHALGAVNRLAESGKALPEAMALATEISKGPQQAMGRIKHLCRHAMRNPLEAQLELEAQFMVEAMGSDESKEGIDAFLNKRQANFTLSRQASE